MRNEAIGRRLIFFAVLGCVVGVSGMLLGWVAHSAGWGICALALPVGWSAGLAALAFDAQRLRIVGGVVAAVLGLALFIWASRPPAWCAETAVAEGELDELCVRVASMRIARERNLMHVFDFNDVPEPIRAEAREHVADLSRNEKFTLCDRTFGKRINDGARTPIEAGLLLSGGLWIALAMLGSIAPAAIRQRIENH